MQSQSNLSNRLAMASTTSTTSKHVTFNPQVTGVEIMRIDDYTAREVSASWYDSAEMDRISHRCCKIIMRMQNGASVAKYCMRGLEGHTKHGSVSKKRNRTISIAAVLMEQSNQWIENRVDEHAIADVYHKTASSCQVWAQAVGQRDQKAAEAIVWQDAVDEVAAGNTREIPDRCMSDPKSNRIMQTSGHAHRVYQEPCGARAA